MIYSRSVNFKKESSNPTTNNTAKQKRFQKYHGHECPWYEALLKFFMFRRFFL